MGFEGAEIAKKSPLVLAAAFASTLDSAAIAEDASALEETLQQHAEMLDTIEARQEAELREALSPQELAMFEQMKTLHAQVREGVQTSVDEALAINDLFIEQAAAGSVDDEFIQKLQEYVSTYQSLTEVYNSVQKTVEEEGGSRAEDEPFNALLYKENAEYGVFLKHQLTSLESVAKSMQFTSALTTDPETASQIAETLGYVTTDTID
jgi:hypothetical protein